MHECWDDTIGGFNAFVSEQKKEGGSLTLIQFDHEYTPCYHSRPIDQVEPLTRETFTPRGSTALLDAIGRAIKEVEARTSTASSVPGPKPTFIILTDGHENSSTKYTKAHLKDLIEDRQKSGWTFIYLGANQDAFAEAGSIGIAPATTMNYDVTRTPEAFRTLSTACSQYAQNQV